MPSHGAGSWPRSRSLNFFGIRLKALNTRQDWHLHSWKEILFAVDAAGLSIPLE